MKIEEEIEKTNPELIKQKSVIMSLIEKEEQ